MRVYDSRARRCRAFSIGKWWDVVNCQQRSADKSHAAWGWYRLEIWHRALHQFKCSFESSGNARVVRFNIFDHLGLDFGRPFGLKHALDRESNQHVETRRPPRIFPGYIVVGSGEASG